MDADQTERRRVALHWIGHQQLDVTPEEMTCWNCGYAEKCESAWDGYNTNGDCLESK